MNRLAVALGSSLALLLSAGLACAASADPAAPPASPPSAADTTRAGSAAEASRWDLGQMSGTVINPEWVRAAAVWRSQLYVAAVPQGWRMDQGSWVARLDDQRWSVLECAITGRVEQLLCWQDKLWAVGEIHAAGETTNECIAGWTGSTWRPLPSTPGNRLRGRAERAALAGTETLILAGNGLSIGTNAPAQVVRWTGTAWAPVGSGLQLGEQATVQALATGRDGRVYLLAEEFEPDRGSVLWCWPSGGRWQRLPAPNRLSAIAVRADGTLFAGGSFKPPFTPSDNPLAEWTGERWKLVGGGVSHPGIAREQNAVLHIGIPALAAWGNDLVVGGGFLRAGEVEANLIARWDGSQWHSLGAGLGRVGPWHADGVRGAVYFETQIPRQLIPDGQRLFVLGHFDRAGDRVAPGLAVWNGSGWQVPDTRCDFETDGSIDGFAVMGDDLYATGLFEVAGHEEALGVARWHRNAWTKLPQHRVIQRPWLDWSMVADANHLWIITRPQSVMPHTPYDVLRWDGARWETLTNVSVVPPSLAAHGGALHCLGRELITWTDAGVKTVAPAPGYPFAGASLGVLSNGQVVAAALDRNVLRDSRIRVLEEGAWKPLDGGPIGGFGRLAMLAAGDDLYVAGGFNSLSSETAAAGSRSTGGAPVAFELAAGGVARWNATSGWTWLLRQGEGSDRGALFMCLASWRGQFFVGGRFRRLGRVAANNIARWDGQRWHPLAGGVDGDVRALAVIGNHLYVGGSFKGVSGKPAANFARWRLE